MKVAILERHKEDGAVEAVFIVESDARSAAISALKAQNPTRVYTFTPQVDVLEVEYDVRMRTTQL